MPGTASAPGIYFSHTTAKQFIKIPSMVFIFAHGT
jgi:hypothetical protein